MRFTTFQNWWRHGTSRPRINVRELQLCVNCYNFSLCCSVTLIAECSTRNYTKGSNSFSAKRSIILDPAAYNGNFAVGSYVTLCNAPSAKLLAMLAGTMAAVDHHAITIRSMVDEVIRGTQPLKLTATILIMRWICTLILTVAISVCVAAVRIWRRPFNVTYSKVFPNLSFCQK